MIIATLEIKHFRNYRHQRLDFSPEKNVIIGKNAQGKSNLLEAVYFLSHLGSFRAKRLRDLVLDGEAEASVRGLILEGENCLNVLASFGRSGRTVTVNGKRTKSVSKARGIVKCVMFSPEDLYLVKGEPTRRRDFLDETMEELGPVEAESLSRYKRALQQRNALLRSWEGSGSGLRGELEPWNEALSKAGASIVSVRESLVKSVEEQVRSSYREITGEEAEVNLEYKGTFDLAADTAEDVEKALYEALRTSHDEEKRVGTTLIGPHRDDIEISLGGREAKHSASQGEQRALSFCMRLAQKAYLERETGTVPILLLDDVLSELDGERKRGVLRAVGSESQAIITATEIQEELADTGGDVYLVEQGRVRRV